MTIDKDFLSKFTSNDEQDEYKRNDSIQIGFEQELKSLTVHPDESARFEARIRLISTSTCQPIDRTLLHIEWRLNDISITHDNHSKYRFGSVPEENRYWMDVQHCQQQDEKVYTIYISYDHGRLHDESSAYLFLDNCHIDNDEQSLQIVGKDFNAMHTSPLATSLYRFSPPTITRLLQPSYQYQLGEQLHFLVEYISPSVDCQSTWQVQHSNDRLPKPIEDGLIVNADCSSILIIESITPQLEGLYIFYVENLYGRATTQTIVTVNSNSIDDDTQQYNEIQDEITNENKEYPASGSSHQNISRKHDPSSSESSEYEELKTHSSNGKSTSSVSTTDEDMIFSSMNEERVDEHKHEIQLDLSCVKDLYSQRHIAYFDPSPKFEYVEPIEQFENEDSTTRITINNDQTANGRDVTSEMKFKLSPPPLPINTMSEEHIYEDIPHHIPVVQTSHSISVQQHSIHITDKDNSANEHSSLFSCSPNSLDEALNNVEQWSDIIIDDDIPEPRSSSRLSQISRLLSVTNDYVDEYDLNHTNDVSSASTTQIISLRNEPVDNTNYVLQTESNNSEQQLELVTQSSVTTDEIIFCENAVNVHEVHLIDHEVECIELSYELCNQSKSIEMNEQTEAQSTTTIRPITSLMKHHQEIEQLIPADLSHSMDHVIETIHVEEELYEAKKTFVTGIQAPVGRLLPTNQRDDESSLELTSVNLLETVSTDLIESALPMSIVPKTSEPFEILDQFDMSRSEDQASETIISTSDEMSSINLSYSNVPVEFHETQADSLVHDQIPIYTLTIIGGRTLGEPQESLSVPSQIDLLPLATMPDQTKITDEQRIPDKIIQDVLAASLEPAQVTHREHIVGSRLSVSAERVNGHEEFFDVEFDTPNEIMKTDVTSEVLPEKASITLAEAEKLQHDAAIEQQEDNFYEAEVDLKLTNVPIATEHYTSIETELDSLTSSPKTTIKIDDNVDVPVEKSANKKEETTTLNTQQIASDKISEPLHKQQTNGSHHSVTNSEELVTVNNSFDINKQKPTKIISDEHAIIFSDSNTSSELEKDLHKTKNELVITEAPMPVQSFRQTSTDTTRSSKTLPVSLTQSSQIKANEISSSITTQSEQEFLPPKFSLRLKPTITINHDDQLQLEVYFTGQPKPTVTWYFKSDVLISSSNIHIVQSHDSQKFYSTLTIQKINSDYDGKFKVIIKNELGEAVSSTQVNVKRACLAVQLHTPTKKTNADKPSTYATNE